MPHMVHELLFVGNDAKSHIVLGVFAGDTGASQGRRPHCACLTPLVPRDWDRYMVPTTVAILFANSCMPVSRRM